MESDSSFFNYDLFSSIKKMVRRKMFGRYNTGRYYYELWIGREITTIDFYENSGLNACGGDIE